MTDVYIDSNVYNEQLNGILKKIAKKIDAALADSDDCVIEAIIDGTYYVFGSTKDFTGKSLGKVVQRLKELKDERDAEISEPDFCGKFYADCFGIDFYKTDNLEEIVKLLEQA